MAASKYMPCINKQGRTCIRVVNTKKEVKYIPMGIANGFGVVTTDQASFNKNYTEMRDYPVLRACQLYKLYMSRVGASAEAVEFIRTVVEVTDDEAKAIVSIRKDVEDKQTPTKRRPGAKPKAETRKRAKGASGEYSSAAAMFRALITDGKLDDDGIFKAVQAEFGLDDNKRSYVKYYRNEMAKAAS